MLRCRLRNKINYRFFLLNSSRSQQHMLEGRRVQERYFCLFWRIPLSSRISHIIQLSFHLFNLRGWALSLFQLGLMMRMYTQKCAVFWCKQKRQTWLLHARSDLNETHNWAHKLGGEVTSSCHIIRSSCSSSSPWRHLLQILRFRICH